VKQEKIIICTAAGDDPCAPISSFLLETKAESVIEGIQKRITETGATKAYMYIPEQYIKAAEKVTALAIDIGIKTGPDSLVCKDKTALIAAMNGEYIQPFFIENEKDLVFDDAPIAEFITVEDAVNYSEGKPNKTFFVHGAVENTCFTFSPWGTSLQNIIDAAGCINKTREIKSVLVGGILGKWINPQEIESVVTEKENPFFSGGIEVFDQSICGVDVMQNIINKCLNASCGKCPLCREGTYQLFSAFKDITEGKAKTDTVLVIKEMAANIALGSFCQFGKNMAGLVISALNIFCDEVEEHIRRKKCIASVCKAFMNLVVLPDVCNGCGECLGICNDDAIEGKKGYIHMIQNAECTKCGKCFEACEARAIVMVSGVKPRLPKRLTKVGQFA
jgi:NADH-quinone oxidoreductase subunit F